MKVLSPGQMRDLEGTAEREAHPPRQLMERAASAAYRIIRREYPLSDKPLLILCGRGNNGGDGLALALLLNHDALICLPLGEPFPGSLGEDHLKACRLRGIPELGREDFLNAGKDRFALIVDGLWGTGLNRPVEGPDREIIFKINELALPVVSLDIPSGVNGLNGRAEGAAVRADRTVIFGLPKGGNLLYPGRELGGVLHVSSLNIPRMLREETPSLFRINRPRPLPERSSALHKGSLGRLLVVGGSSRYGGAPRFASAGFLRSGGGYVHVALPGTAVLSLAIGLPEAVLHPLGGEGRTSLGREDLSAIRALSGGTGFMVLGPGIGLAEDTGDLVRALVEETARPLILDGDGLTHLAGREELIRGKNIYLTPHPGEASRLLGTDTASVERDRPGAVRELADRYGVPVVLKGAHSLITAPGEEIRMNLSGDSSLATAGSGDILCGVLAAVMGYGLTGTDALGTAVFLHGLAGEAAGRRGSPDGVIASDIIDCLPGVMGDYRSGFGHYGTGIHGYIESLS